MRAQRLEKILTGIGRPRVLVVGDLILDHYVEGRVDRVSPEAPIQIFRHLTDDYRLGGAANVAHNLAALGARASLIGVGGQDEDGRVLLRELERAGVDASGVVLDGHRPTTRKSRMLAGNQQVLRVDREEQGPISCVREVCDRVEKVLGDADLVIISDYAKGVLTDEVLRFVIDAAGAASCPVLVDPKGRDYSKYRGATALTPNLLEAQLFTGRELRTHAERVEVGLRAIEELELEAFIITLSKDGMFVVRRDGVSHHVRTRVRNVYDVTGAGDTAIATVGLCLAAGNGFEAALSLANLAGGLVVGKVGTVPITREELRSSVREEDRSFSGRLRSVNRLVDMIDRERDAGTRVALVIGEFRELTSHSLELFRLCGQRAERVVALIAGGAEAPLLEDLRTVDHILSGGADLAAELKQIGPDFVAYERGFSARLDCDAVELTLPLA